MFRPIRPKPLIPTFIPMREMLCGAELLLRRPRVTVRLSQVLDAPEAVVDRGLGEVHAPCQLAEVQIRVLAPPASHLAQRRRQLRQRAVGVERLDGRRLAETRADRLADVRRLEVEPAID